MKYIRTKDGRIAEIKENMVVKVCDDATRLVYKKQPYFSVLYGDDDILKQADTIEKLCDCYIVIKNNRHSYYTKKQFNRTRTDHFLLARDVKLGKKIVYGAIWTDKGLIYVAKMNGEGELELL